MTNDIGRLVEPSTASEWIRESLGWGTPLAQLVAERLAPSSLASARLLVPREAEERCGVLDDVGRGISTRSSDAVATDFFRGWDRRGAMTLVVEDELGLRGEPGIGTSTSFIGDRIVHWTTLEDPAAGPLLMRRVSTGRPLNAFVCGGAPEELGLEEDRELDAVDLAALVDRMRTVIVSAYDNEAFLAAVVRSAPKEEGHPKG
jgi:hypothetical protein